MASALLSFASLAPGNISSTGQPSAVSGGVAGGLANFVSSAAKIIGLNPCVTKYGKDACLSPDAATFLASWKYPLKDGQIASWETGGRFLYPKWDFAVCYGAKNGVAPPGGCGAIKPSTGTRGCNCSPSVCTCAPIGATLSTKTGWQINPAGPADAGLGGLFSGGGLSLGSLGASLGLTTPTGGFNLVNIALLVGGAFLFWKLIGSKT
jgi:hypothetical protein